MHHYYGRKQHGYKMVMISNFSDSDVAVFIGDTQLKHMDQEMQQIREQLDSFSVNIGSKEAAEGIKDIEVNAKKGNTLDIEMKCDDQLKSTEVIGDALKGLCGNDWNVYLQNFQNRNIGDDGLIHLTESDLRTLIPKIGPRSRFRKWLNEMK